MKWEITVTASIICFAPNVYIWKAMQNSFGQKIYSNKQTVLSTSQHLCVYVKDAFVLKFTIAMCIIIVAAKALIRFSLKERGGYDTVHRIISFLKFF